MERDLKKQWFKSFLFFHSAFYFVPIISKFVEAYFRGWFNEYVFNASYFYSILLTQPVTYVLIGYISYYFIYKLERQYALKVVTCLSFLLTFFMGYRLYGTANYDWPSNYYIEIMINQACIFYAALFYFITSFRWYSTQNEHKNIIKSLCGCLFRIVYF